MRVGRESVYIWCHWLVRTRGNVEIETVVISVDSKRERRPLWNTDRAQAPGSATHGADLAARYPEAVLSIALPMPYPVDQSPASTTR